MTGKYWAWVKWDYETGWKKPAFLIEGDITEVLQRSAEQYMQTYKCEEPYVQWGADLQTKIAALDNPDGIKYYYVKSDDLRFLELAPPSYEYGNDGRI